jgi:ribosomal protein S18
MTAKILTLDEITEKLQDRILTKVSDSTKLSYPTVWKIARGKSEDVDYKTVVILSEYLNPTTEASE